MFCLINIFDKFWGIVKEWMLNNVQYGQSIKNIYGNSRNVLGNRSTHFKII